MPNQGHTPDMARLKTPNTPDLEVLLAPPTPMMLAVEQAVLRGRKWSLAAAPVAERIAVRIAGAITLDLIHAGQRLLENDLGEALHVSRAPVREALRILERERMVEFQARRGAVVTAPDANDLHDIYVVRDALYQLLLQELMERQLKELQAAFRLYMPRIAKAAEAGSVDDYTVETFLLNLAMTELSSNQLIVDLLTSIALRTARYVRLGLVADPERLRSSLRTWRALQRAIDRGDIAEVRATAHKRIESSRDSAVRAMPAAAARGGAQAAAAEKTPSQKAPAAA